MKHVYLIFFAAFVTACATAEPERPMTLTAEDMRDLMSLTGIDSSESKPAPENLSDYPFGSDKNPVRADGPSGQHAYLSRLVCPEGDTPKHERIGSFGFGPYGTIIDGYEVVCDKGSETIIYIDAYHSGVQESRAVEGFRLRPAE